MKKLVLALTAIAAFTAPALAADMAARPYAKAAPMAAVYNWTGFYIFGGGGGGIWDANQDTRVAATGAASFTVNRKSGWRRLVRHRRWRL